MSKKKKDVYIKNNKDLPVDVTGEYNVEMMSEMQKCKDDIFYFAEKYFTIVHPDRGKEIMQLYAPQKRAIDKIVKNRRTIICASRQIGKRLCLNTPVPTPDGWSTMGELRDGDTIFDWNGAPTKIVKAHDIVENTDAYEITFSNGDKIKADAEHEWFTQHKSETKAKYSGSVKTTKEIYESLYYGIKNKRPAHRIPLHKPEKSKKRNKYVYIKNIEKIDSVPMRCITVDNDDQMYLVGKTCIPTHNTSLMTVVCLWYTLFNKNYNIAILANQEKMALEILSRIKTAYKNLPTWLKSGVPVWSQGQVTFSNESNIFASTTSENSIRGQTTNLIFLDEFAFVPPEIAESFYTAVSPALSASKTSKIVIVSTPNGVSNKYYEIFQNAERGDKGWAYEKMYWWEIPDRDEAWKEDQLKLLNYDRDKWDQEYDLVFLTSGSTALNKNLMDRLEKQCYIPDVTFDDGDYLVYDTPKKGHVYSIGVDVSEGIGQDYSVAQILDVTDPKNISQVGVYSTNSSLPYVFAERLYQIACSWGKPFLCIERNGPGGQVIDALKNVYEYDNIVTASKVNDSSGRYNNQLGIVNHQNTKLAGNNNMRYYLETKECLELYDGKTVAEFRTYVRKANRSWGALKGKTDDHVMALIWGTFILEKTVAEKYLEILDIDENGRVESIKDPMQFEKDTLIEKIKSNPNFRIKNSNFPTAFVQRGNVFSTVDIPTNNGSIKFIL